MFGSIAVTPKWSDELLCGCRLALQSVKERDPVWPLRLPSVGIPPEQLLLHFPPGAADAETTLLLLPS